MVFADTSGLMALVNPKDTNHNAAKNWFAETQPKLVITDYIVDELLTLALARINKDFSIKIGEWLREQDCLEIIKITEKEFYEAWSVFDQYSDKNWSLTDCTSYIVIKQKNFEKAFAFDTHFDQFEAITVP